ncbi:hypothetical protein C1645_739472 [Glomus cerebriforme]|uniref:Uncharacterized protein n=1 Tax=Glomus cerebriforme TaxID=658196 RepID=A0A397SZV7_9GLOM|nr:hypothetical protein C1645_739472 [Glomus cerebriforme]
MAVDELKIQTLILCVQKYLIKHQYGYLQQNPTEILKLFINMKLSQNYGTFVLSWIEKKNDSHYNESDLSQDNDLPQDDGSSHEKKNKKYLQEPQVIPSPLNSAEVIEASDFTEEQHKAFFKEIQENSGFNISEEVITDIFGISNGYAGLESAYIIIHGICCQSEIP